MKNSKLINNFDKFLLQEAKQLINKLDNSIDEIVANQIVSLIKEYTYFPLITPLSMITIESMILFNKCTQINKLIGIELHDDTLNFLTFNIIVNLYSLKENNPGIANLENAQVEHYVLILVAGYLYLKIMLELLNEKGGNLQNFTQQELKKVIEDITKTKNIQNLISQYNKLY